MRREKPSEYALRPASRQDLDAVCEIIRAYSLDTLGVENNSRKNVELTWTQPGFAIDTDTCVAEMPDGRVVGYAEVEDLEPPHVRIACWVRVHPDFSGQGIEEALLSWAEDRARESLPKSPPQARVTLSQGVPEPDAALRQMFEARDFAIIRHFWRMGIELDQEIPVPEWPEGVSVRAYAGKADLVPTVHAFRDAFQDHWGHVDTPFEQELAQWDHWINNDEEFDPSLTFLAVSRDEIVGLASCDLKHPEDPCMGYVAVLGVCRSWRRKGIALALLHHAFRVLKERGQLRTCLGVDATSLTGANKLYEAAGMRMVRQIDVFEKELRSGEDLSLQTLNDEGSET